MATKPKILVAAVQPPVDRPVPVDIKVAGAIKALHRGDASPHQQQLALQWIIREAGGKAYFPYRKDTHDTAFALGRLFVADTIVGLFNADLSSLRGQNHELENP